MRAVLPCLLTLEPLGYSPRAYSLKICVANKTEAIYQATRILARNIMEHCNPHRLLIDGLVMTNLGDDGSKPSE